MGDFGLFLLQSCMKSDENKEYYEILEISSHASTDEIKRAYKKASLAYHPDKLKQRGIEVSTETRQKFVKIKDAYEVLSDPKRRKIYDRLGSTGLKFYENPSSVTPQELLKNFQRNHGSRLVLALFIALAFACLLILPILFCLKCDGDIPEVAWTALWTPMWIYDALTLYVIIMFVTTTSHTKKTKSSSSSSSSNNNNGSGGNDGDETNNTTSTDDKNANDEDDEQNYIPMSTKIYTLTQTIIFILIQIFILIHLDKVTPNWSWFEVFIPWLLYDGISAISIILPAFIATIPTPESVIAEANRNSGVEEGNANAGLEEDLLRKRFVDEQVYLEKCIDKCKLQFQFFIYLLRIWQAIFLALQLDSEDFSWNWGLVFLPIWLYFLLQLYMIRSFRMWGHSLLQGIDIDHLTEEDIQNNPKIMMKLNQAQSLLAVSSGTFFTQIPVLLTALLLVCRLEVSSYSTFIILIALFIGLGCCCCVTFCGLIVASTVDMDELEREEMMKAERQRQQQADAQASSDDVSKTINLATFVMNPVDAANTNTNTTASGVSGGAGSSSSSGNHTDNTNAEYGTFAAGSGSSYQPPLVSTTGVSNKIEKQTVTTSAVSDAANKSNKEGIDSASATAAAVPAEQFDDID